MNPFRYLTLINVFFIGVSVAIYAPIVLLVATTRNRNLTTWFIRSWNKSVIRIFLLRVHAEGMEHYDPKRPCLLVSNHQSHLDIPALYSKLGGHIRMVAKKELFEIPLFGPCLKACEFIPIHRESRQAGAEVSRKIRERIRSGLQMWVAPEGTRSQDGVVRTFKRGSFGIAIDAGVPIQPIAIIDARDALPKKSILPIPFRTIHIKILPPIPTEGMGSEEKANLAERCRKLIADTIEEARQS
jgi:1-acyl-sn-glycerol-3-phosphate acyltransferase